MLLYVVVRIFAEREYSRTNEENRGRSIRTSILDKNDYRVIMVYIASDGSLADTKKRKWRLSIIRDFIVGIFDFIGLFFRTLTASPTTLENERVSVCFFCCIITMCQ